MTDRGKGLILAAPSSGSGKTVVTLGILRALAQQGHAIRSAKSGPDYIDPRFHAAATGRECVNLDAWAMAAPRLAALAQGPEREPEQKRGLLLIEGAMGLFDGAPPDGRGATADLASVLNLPVVLIVDAASMAQSVAPLVNGFARHRPDVTIAGVILNRTGSPRHEEMLRNALGETGVPVLGAIRRNKGLTLPSRHLGLVQAEEHPELEDFLERAADIISAGLDLGGLAELAAPLPAGRARATLPPPGQRIAVARDSAFAFAYPHMIGDWRAAGAEITFFSPLADAPPPPADFIFLPGGYPELHAGRLAANRRFIEGLRRAAQTTPVYGECGGFMVLGQGLIDAKGTRHQMAGLLDLETSFADRRLHLGYRRLIPAAGPWNTPLNGHEFHFATTLRAHGNPLFQATDAQGATLPPMGLVRDKVSGSFAHVIDVAE